MGNYLKYWREQKGLSQVDLANTSGINQAVISHIERGRNNPSLDTVNALSKALDITPGQLLDGPSHFASTESLGKALNVAHDFIEIPYIGNSQFMNGDSIWVPYYKINFSAGVGVSAIDNLTKVMLPFKSDWIHHELNANPNNLVMVDVYGDSMEPTFSEGSTVIVDTAKRDLKTNGVYVFRAADELFVKRVERQGLKVLIKSDNPRYEAFYLEGSEMSVFGRVVWQSGRVK